MSSTDNSESNKAIRLLQDDVEKGISEKEVQNLVLKKILDAVGNEKETVDSFPPSKIKLKPPKK
jgi:dipeptidase